MCECLLEIQSVGQGVGKRWGWIDGSSTRKESEPGYVVRELEVVGRCCGRVYNEVIV